MASVRRIIINISPLTSLRPKKIFIFTLASSHPIFAETRPNDCARNIGAPDEKSALGSISMADAAKVDAIIEKLKSSADSAPRRHVGPFGRPTERWQPFSHDIFESLRTL